MTGEGKGGGGGGGKEPARCVTLRHRHPHSGASVRFTGRMPHAPILQLLGAVFLAAAAVLWLSGLARLHRHYRTHPAPQGRTGTLGAMPHHRSAPRLESVELTQAERDAFAGLIRQFGDGRP